MTSVSGISNAWNWLKDTAVDIYGGAKEVAKDPFGFVGQMGSEFDDGAKESAVFWQNAILNQHVRKEDLSTLEAVGTVVGVGLIPAAIVGTGGALLEVAAAAAGAGTGVKVVVATALALAACDTTEVKEQPLDVTDITYKGNLLSGTPIEFTVMVQGFNPDKHKVEITLDAQPVDPANEVPTITPTDDPTKFMITFPSPAHGIPSANYLINSTTVFKDKGDDSVLTTVPREKQVQVYRPNYNPTAPTLRVLINGSENSGYGLAGQNVFLKADLYNPAPDTENFEYDYTWIISKVHKTGANTPEATLTGKVAEMDHVFKDGGAYVVDLTVKITNKADPTYTGTIKPNVSPMINIGYANGKNPNNPEFYIKEANGDPAISVGLAAPWLAVIEPMDAANFDYQIEWMIFDLFDRKERTPQEAQAAKLLSSFTLGAGNLTLETVFAQPGNYEVRSRMAMTDHAAPDVPALVKESAAAVQVFPNGGNAASPSLKMIAPDSAYGGDEISLGVAIMPYNPEDYTYQINYQFIWKDQAGLEQKRTKQVKNADSVLMPALPQVQEKTIVIASAVVNITDPKGVTRKLIVPEAPIEVRPSGQSAFDPNVDIFLPRSAHINNTITALPVVRPINKDNYTYTYLWTIHDQAGDSYQPDQINPDGTCDFTPKLPNQYYFDLTVVIDDGNKQRQKVAMSQSVRAEADADPNMPIIEVAPADGQWGTFAGLPKYFIAKFSPDLSKTGYTYQVRWLINGANQIGTGTLAELTFPSGGIFELTCEVTITTDKGVKLPARNNYKLISVTDINPVSVSPTWDFGPEKANYSAIEPGDSRNFEALIGPVGKAYKYTIDAFVNVPEIIDNTPASQSLNFTVPQDLAFTRTLIPLTFNDPGKAIIYMRLTVADQQNKVLFKQLKGPKSIDVAPACSNHYMPDPLNAATAPKEVIRGTTDPLTITINGLTDYCGNPVDVTTTPLDDVLMPGYIVTPDDQNRALTIVGVIKSGDGITDKFPLTLPFKDKSGADAGKIKVYLPANYQTPEILLPPYTVFVGMPFDLAVTPQPAGAAVNGNIVNPFNNQKIAGFADFSASLTMLKAGSFPITATIIPGGGNKTYDIASAKRLDVYASPPELRLFSLTPDSCKVGEACKPTFTINANAQHNLTVASVVIDYGDGASNSFYPNTKTFLNTFTHQYDNSKATFTYFIKAVVTDNAGQVTTFGGGPDGRSFTVWPKPNP